MTKAMLIIEVTDDNEVALHMDDDGYFVFDSEEARAMANSLNEAADVCDRGTLQ